MADEVDIDTSTIGLSPKELKAQADRNRAASAKRREGLSRLTPDQIERATKEAFGHEPEDDVPTAAVAPNANSETPTASEAITEQRGIRKSISGRVRVQINVPADAHVCLKKGLIDRRQSLMGYATLAFRRQAIADGVIAESDWPLDKD